MEKSFEKKSQKVNFENRRKDQLAEKKKLEERAFKAEQHKEAKRKEYNKRGRKLLKRLESLPKEKKCEPVKNDSRNVVSKKDKEYVFSDPVIKEYKESFFNEALTKKSRALLNKKDIGFFEGLGLGVKMLTGVFKDIKWKYWDKKKLIKYDYEKEILTKDPFIADGRRLVMLKNLDKGRLLMEQSTIGKKILEKKEILIKDLDELSDLDSTLHNELGPEYANAALQEARKSVADLVVDDILKSYKKRKFDMETARDVMGSIESRLKGLSTGMANDVLSRVLRESKIVNIVGQSYHEWFTSKKTVIQKELQKKSSLYKEDTIAFWSAMSGWKDKPAFGDMLIAQYNQNMESSEFKILVDSIITYVGSRFSVRDSRTNDWDDLLLEARHQGAKNKYLSDPIVEAVHHAASDRLSHMTVSRFRAWLADSLYGLGRRPKEGSYALVDLLGPLTDIYFVPQRWIANAIHPFKRYGKSRESAGADWTHEYRYEGKELSDDMPMSSKIPIYTSLWD